MKPIEELPRTRGVAPKCQQMNAVGGQAVRNATVTTLTCVRSFSENKPLLIDRPLRGRRGQVLPE